METTPKLEPNMNENPPDMNFNLQTKEEDGDNAEKFEAFSDSYDIKLVTNKEGYPERKVVLKYNKKNEAELLNIINYNQYKYLPEASKEVIDNINKMKDYKWKLGVILKDKINNLNQRINEEKEKIKKKEKEISESKIYENKINYLKQLIKKEDDEGFSKENSINIELKKKKQDLIDKINKIETNKKNMKDNMIKKYFIMNELKEKLKNSINELYSIQQQIRSRKFAHEQEEMKEPIEKPDPEQQNLLYLSQNIGEHINKNLLISKDP